MCCVCVSSLERGCAVGMAESFVCVCVRVAVHHGAGGPPGGVRQKQDGPPHTVVQVDHREAAAHPPAGSANHVSLFATMLTWLHAPHKVYSQSLCVCVHANIWWLLSSFLYC